MTPVLPARPFFYAIIDAAMAGERSLNSWVNLLAGAGRAPLVQWRFKGLTDAEALRGARELREATRSAGVLLIINDRPDIARIVDADGVHVGQEDLHPRDVRALMGAAIVGVSTHNQAQFEAACETPADYLAIGPVFGTTTKSNPDPAVGLDFVSWASARTTKPLVAIGGITASNSDAVVRAGARGVAVISSVMKAEHPDRAVADLVAAMEPRPPR